MPDRSLPWRLDWKRNLFISLPLAWALMQDATMRTTVRVVTGWDQGYADLYQYGFPFAFIHWGTHSSEEDVLFVLPLLLDFMVYFLFTSMLLGALNPFLTRWPVWRRVLSVVAWTWALLTLPSILWALLSGGPYLVTPFEVLWVQDPVFSWRKGGWGEFYGPH